MVLWILALFQVTTRFQTQFLNLMVTMAIPQGIHQEIYRSCTHLLVQLLLSCCIHYTRQISNTSLKQHRARLQHRHYQPLTSLGCTFTFKHLSCRWLKHFLLPSTISNSITSIGNLLPVILIGTSLKLNLAVKFSPKGRETTHISLSNIIPQLPLTGKCLPQLLFGSTRNLLHCPALELTCLALENHEKNAEDSRNCSSSDSLSSDDQACHICNSFDSLEPNGQLFRSHSISVHHYNHLDVILRSHCKVSNAQSFVKPVYLSRTILSDPSFLAHLSSYPLSETFQHAHQTCHFVDSPLLEVDMVVTLPSTHHQYPNSHSSQSPSEPCPVHIMIGDQIVAHIQLQDLVSSHPGELEIFT